MGWSVAESDEEKEKEKEKKSGKAYLPAKGSSCRHRYKSREQGQIFKLYMEERMEGGWIRRKEERKEGEDLELTSSTVKILVL